MARVNRGGVRIARRPCPRHHTRLKPGANESVLQSLREPVPADSSRRPWATVVRGRFEQSTHNAATGSRRHGFMVPMRGFWSLVATGEPELGQEDLGQENGRENLPAHNFPACSFPGSGAEIAAVGQPWILSQKPDAPRVNLGTRQKAGVFRRTTGAPRSQLFVRLRLRDRDFTPGTAKRAAPTMPASLPIVAGTILHSGVSR